MNNKKEIVSSETRKSKIIQIKKGIWRTYDATDGLPGPPTRLLQDKYGYLWIGTGAGLCRYDGTEFFTYTVADGLANDYVTALCQDKQGKIWVGTGNGISCFDGKVFTNYTTEDGLINNQVNALCQDNQGKFWIGTMAGLSRFDGRGWGIFPISPITPLIMACLITA